MTKWHNGPNGPGQCKATKGQCPYGGASDHYESKEQAMEQFQKKNEAEYGLIPENNGTPWPSGNPNPWETKDSYSAGGIRDEGVYVRQSATDKNKYEFFSHVVSTDGSSHIISKGTVDLKDKKIKTKEVENHYGIKKKDSPAQFAQSVISYYGGDNFDNDPVYLNARRSDDIGREISDVYLKHGINTEQVSTFSNSADTASSNVIFPTEEETPKKRKKRGYSEEDYLDI